jgi:hypothetical protein
MARPHAAYQYLSQIKRMPCSTYCHLPFNGWSLLQKLIVNYKMMPVVLSVDSLFHLTVACTSFTNLNGKRPYVAHFELAN